MTKDEIDNLIINNMNLVYEIVWKYIRKYSNYVEFEDLVSVGNIGLVKAANTYDKSKGYTFSTYVYKVVNNEILMFLRHIKNQLKNNVSITSLDKPLAFDNDHSLLDIIIDNYDLEEAISDEILINMLYRFIDEINSDDIKKVILFKLQDKTQQEIADLLSISQSQVSRLLSKAIYLLRLKFRKEGLL